ncbi:MAG TPA: outer membrane beta-barrel protein [Terriglobales bacterium]|nr:outer membrane beta-barrel protein [Terriglobales bacterium]
MPKNIRIALLLIASSGWMVSAHKALAQSAGNLEFGANYIYTRTNAPPGDCGCFSLNGGAGWVGYNFMTNLALVGEVSGSHASNIEGTTGSLTLTSFLGGLRYSRHHNRFAPFGQVLLGGAHASGQLTPNSSGLAGSGNGFAMTAGGGLDVTLSHHFSLRAVQADYFLTRFSNSGNDRQNNFRIGAGIVYRFR